MLRLLMHVASSPFILSCPAILLIWHCMECGRCILLWLALVPCCAVRTVACTFHPRFSCSVREFPFCSSLLAGVWCLVFGVFLDNTNKLLTAVVVSVTESVRYSRTGLPPPSETQGHINLMQQFATLHACLCKSLS